MPRLIIALIILLNSLLVLAQNIHWTTIQTLESDETRVSYGTLIKNSYKHLIVSSDVFPVSKYLYYYRQDSVSSMWEFKQTIKLRPHIHGNDYKIEDFWVSDSFLVIQYYKSRDSNYYYHYNLDLYAINSQGLWEKSDNKILLDTFSTSLKFELSKNHLLISEPTAPIKQNNSTYNFAGRILDLEIQGNRFNNQMKNIFSPKPTSGQWFGNWIFVEDSLVCVSEIRPQLGDSSNPEFIQSFRFFKTRSNGLVPAYNNIDFNLNQVGTIKLLNDSTLLITDYKVSKIELFRLNDFEFKPHATYYGPSNIPITVSRHSFMGNAVFTDSSLIISASNWSNYDTGQVFHEIREYLFSNMNDDSNYAYTISIPTIGGFESYTSASTLVKANDQVLTVGLNRNTQASNSKFSKIAVLENESCNSDTIQIVKHRCSSFSSISKEFTIYSSGTYLDSLIMEGRCSQYFWMDVQIDSHIKVEENYTFCSEYISPSGKYSTRISDVIFDTLRSANRCDSVIKINAQFIGYHATLELENGILSTISRDKEYYQWIDCYTGRELPSENSWSFIPRSSGLYALKMYSEDCDTFITDCYFVSDFKVNTQTLPEIKVYPNPNNGVFTLDWLTYEENAKISILNPEGQIVKHYIIEDSFSKRFELRLTPGVYSILVVKASGQTARTKMILL
ncbi:T9SS type A sorting domain-containing protein [bacterium]|nr:T9SS type A sorting domain-containing protein [bacterium]